MDHGITDIANLIGTKVSHGSLSSSTPELIAQITFLKDQVVEIEFESGCFTRMKAVTFRDLMRYGEISYKDLLHVGLSVITMPA
jgi:hypothetical protein